MLDNKVNVGFSLGLKLGDIYIIPSISSKNMAFCVYMCTALHHAIQKDLYDVNRKKLSEKDIILQIKRCNDTTGV